MREMKNTGRGSLAAPDMGMVYCSTEMALAMVFS